MSLIGLATSTPVPHANARLVDVASLQRALEGSIEGEVRFDAVSRALYSTDASVYQIAPLGVVVAKSRGDLIRIVELATQFRCPITLRGGGTAQAGQSIGAGLQIDTSKYYNRILELHVAERWVRVQPGIVLDELNAALRPHGLRFAPDVSTASRASVGGMMANNSSGARSFLYGKTIDHVLEQEVLLADGTVTHFRALDSAELAAAMHGDTLEAECYRTIYRLGYECADEVDRRFPKVLRRVGGYNLDEFTSPGRPFNLAKLMVGSEGTLGVVLEAKLNLVPLPKAKAVLVVQFRELLEALAATPLILTHKPSACEVMDKFILDHTYLSPNLQRVRETFIEGDPGAILCIEFYGDTREDLTPRLVACEQDLAQHGYGYRYFHALEPAEQGRVWNLREAALGLSMTMKEDAKSLSFVEDTAVAPEKLRDYIERFLQLIEKHDTKAGVYAHASVGCLHVRPVVNMKTTAGVRKFEAIANDVADLVLEFGGALSGEHGDGMVRGPFMEKMFGPVLYDAFRTIKRTFDPAGIFNPGKIVDCPPITENLRFGAGYVSANPRTFFDYAEYGGMGGAVEMCSGLGACRKTLEGTMCPSYMATREETHTTRGRANVLRLAMGGKLASAGLNDKGVYEALDLCLECRACKAECPVGVDMARFKSEFLAGYWQTYGTPLHAQMLGNVRSFAKLGSPFAGIVNWASGTRPVRLLNESVFGIDRRRTLPALNRRTLASRAKGRGAASPGVLLFNDTFTNFYDPEVGVAVWDVLEAGGSAVALAPNYCCGRPLISKGLLAKARAQARQNTDALYEAASAGKKIVFCEPSCLSAIREDVPSLLRGEEQKRARVVADACVLFEEYAAGLPLPLQAGPAKILLHGHCHQKSMGLLPPAKALLEKIPGAAVVDLDAGCCGMAGSFGYSKEHFDISRQIGERKLFPQIRAKDSSSQVVAAGTSCRHQIHDFTDERAIHPAVLLRSLLTSGKGR
ncbi:MAG TPA: FAD-linked oxidase C-terminal domain-containing protein [Bryobacteraceae bacterium]|nr:FAD-linked oxidase C-terminal domain-containing protein [Bryobacteraceae bacterium]